MPAADLRELIERTQFAISNEETRYYLNGIYVHCRRQRARPRCCAPSPPTATAWRAPRPRRPTGAKGMPGIIVPQKDRRRGAEAARWRRRRRRGRSVATPRSASPSAAWCCSKLIEGTFPDYDRVTPKNNDKQMNVDRAASRPPSIASRPLPSERGGKAVKLSLQGRPARTLGHQSRPRHGQRGTAVEFEPESFEIGFNARYLLDIIGQIRRRQRGASCSTTPARPRWCARTARPRRSMC